jgi:SAM-dependent methyltransferase
MSPSVYRQRARRLVRGAARRALGHSGEDAQRTRSVAFRRSIGAGALAREEGTVTHLLHGRLDMDDIAEVERLIRGTKGAWDHYFPGAERVEDPGLLLTVGMWLGSERLAEKTGLLRGEPPEDVHAMTRGALTAAGGLYEADMVVDALLSAGTRMQDVSVALDFGCSSGRVVRTLAAAYPEISFLGCDPNGPAITWASANLPGIDFFVNGSTPPLTLEDSTLDFVYAISIWSHFEPRRGLEWLGEMQRLLRPGGHLVLTTHGWGSIDHYVAEGLRSPVQAREILDSLYRQGYWYAPEFGEEGDWGVVDPCWGTAFLSPEWLLTQLSPDWRVLEFAPARNQGNQDVYVLQRV